MQSWIGMSNTWGVVLFGMLLSACGAPVEGESTFSEPTGEQAQQAAGDEYTGPLARACGCADMTEYSVPAGGCFAIASGIWGAIEDDIACFDLTPSNATPADCSRTCTGYFEAMNPTSQPIKILAFDKLTHAQAKPGIMSKGIVQCDRMFNGPQDADKYKNLDPFTTDVSGLLVRSKGGPKVSTFPPPGPSVCP